MSKSTIFKCLFYAAFALAWPSVSAPAFCQESAQSLLNRSEPALQRHEQTQQKSDDQQDLPWKYTGNLYTHKFHRPSCPYSRVMAGFRRTRFHFRNQATAQGYAPCRYCLPPFWKTVQATIKFQDIETKANGGPVVESKGADNNSGKNGARAPLGTPEEQSNICRP